MQTWVILDRVETGDGVLELRRRGSRDFLIALDGRVLMTSVGSRSEQALGTLVTSQLRRRRAPRVLIAGLGMGITLRAVLDTLPTGARVTVAEIQPAVVRWCDGPLAGLTAHAIRDPRVRITTGDVADRIRAAARADAPARFDAIALDLYEGIRPVGRLVEDPVYGPAALARARAALAAGGVFARWCEQPDAGFERRLRSTGFETTRHRVGGAGRRHTVYLALVGAREAR